MAGTAKAWTQAIFALLAGLVPFIAAHTLTPTEVVNEFLLFFSAIAVGVVPNLTAGVAKYAKGIIAVGLAVGTLLLSYFGDGSYAISATEWMQLIGAALGAAGVIGLPAPQHPSPLVLTGGRAG